MNDQQATVNSARFTSVLAEKDIGNSNSCKPSPVVSHALIDVTRARPEGAKSTREVEATEHVYRLSS